MKHIHLFFLDSLFPFPGVAGTIDTSFFPDKPRFLPFLYFSTPSLYNKRTDLDLSVMINSIIAEFLLADPPVLSPICIILYSENTNGTTYSRRYNQIYYTSFFLLSSPPLPLPNTIFSFSGCMAPSGCKCKISYDIIQTE